MKVLVNSIPVSFDAARREDELARVFRELYESNEIVQEVVLDGVCYRDNYYDQILKTIDTASELQISTVSEVAVVTDLHGELRNYLPNVLRAFDSIPELLYGEMNPENWKLIVQLLEGMNWVSQCVFHLRHHAEKVGKSNQVAVLDQFLQNLAPLLADLERSLQESDNTTAGDLLKYEMPDVFGLLLNHLENGEPA